MVLVTLWRADELLGRFVVDHPCLLVTRLNAVEELMSCWGDWSLTTLACLLRDRTLGLELKVMIGRRRLEFGGTQGRMELEEPLVNSFFLGLPLRALKGSLVTKRFWPFLAFFLSLLFYPPVCKRIECLERLIL